MTEKKNRGGRPPLDPEGSRRIPISFPREQALRLERRAELTGVPMADLVRRYVAAGLEATATVGEEIRRRIDRGEQVRLTKMNSDFGARFSGDRWICHEETPAGHVRTRDWFLRDDQLAAEAERRIAAGWILD